MIVHDISALGSLGSGCVRRVCDGSCVNISVFPVLRGAMNTLTIRRREGARRDAVVQIPVIHVLHMEGSRDRSRRDPRAARVPRACGAPRGAYKTGSTQRRRPVAWTMCYARPPACSVSGQCANSSASNRINEDFMYNHKLAQSVTERCTPKNHAMGESRTANEHSASAGSSLPLCYRRVCYSRVRLLVDMQRR